MEYSDNLVMSAKEYAAHKMKIRLMRMERYIDKYTPDGRISWCNFDKENFEKKLEKSIKKIYRRNINLNELWREVISDTGLYIQQDFLENAYGYKFKMKGKYRDYGFVVFYGKSLITNPNCSLELVENWFFNVMLKNYKKARSAWSFFSNNQFSFSQRWYPICEAAIYFNKKSSKEAIKNHIITLCKLFGIEIKYIDEYDITVV